MEFQDIVDVIVEADVTTWDNGVDGGTAVATALSDAEDVVDVSDDWDWASWADLNGVDR
jgi:hypothetical protein